MGYLLFVVATLLWLPITFLNFIAVLFKYRNTAFFKTMDGFFFSTSVDIDKFGNRNFRTILNYWLIKDGGCRFGSWNETISSVLGKNQRDGTLTRLGRVLCYVLDSLDKDHCKNSIKKNKKVLTRLKKGHNQLLSDVGN
jgi:hypothetical protein